MFNVRDEGALPGLAMLVQAPADGKLDEELIAERARALAAADLPVAATMGVSDLRALVERVLFRKLVRELPEEDCSMPWFECHVPPGGSTILKSSETSTSSNTLELKLFGSGVGAGRKVSITVSSAAAPRTTCATFLLDFRVKPRIYNVRGVESVELEVIECRGKSIVSHEHCPFCGVSPDTVDRFGFRFGEHLDLRKDKVSTKLKLQLAVEDSLSIDAGLKLAAFPVELKLGAKVARGSTFEVESEFPAGALYRAYARVGGGPVQTEMWAVERGR